MKTLIIALVLIIISLFLSKRNGTNNYFSSLVVAVVIIAVWSFGQSWGWSVFALYTTAVGVGFTIIYKIDFLGNPMFSLFTRLYYKNLIKRDCSEFSEDHNEELKGFVRMMSKLRRVVIFAMCCVIAFYSYHLVIGEIWWKWVIIAPIGITFIVFIILSIRKWLNKL